MDRITSVLMDLAQRIDENAFYEKQNTKEELRKTKEKIEKSYESQANATGRKSWINDITASGALGATCAGFFMPTDSLQKVTEVVANTCIPTIARSFEANQDREITQHSGSSQVGLKDQDIQYQKLQNASEMANKANQVASDALKFSEQIIS